MGQEDEVFGGIWSKGLGALKISELVLMTQMLKMVVRVLIQLLTMIPNYWI